MEKNTISAFIDDEMQIEEKIDFVQAVHSDPEFKDEALELLQQEVFLRCGEGMPLPPPVKMPATVTVRWQWLKPIGLFGGGLATALVLIGLFWGIIGASQSQHLHRFVVYQPNVQQAAITGDFTGWKALDMQPAGYEGYWEIVLSLSPGEHRYSFLMDGKAPMADPTELNRERDDFGGQNSIMVVPPDTRI